MNLDLVSSVTTNPKIMTDAKVKDIHEMIKLICEYSIYDLSVELVDPFKSVDELVDEAVGYYECNEDKVVIKVPIIDKRTPILIQKLEDYEIPINLTCVMSTYQAIMGLEYEPRYISFFYRRMVDFYNNRYKAQAQITQTQIYQHKHKIGSETEFICGSIRDPEDITECFNAGTDIVTVPYDVLLKSFIHPKSEEAILEFTTKWANKDGVEVK